MKYKYMRKDLRQYEADEVKEPPIIKVHYVFTDSKNGGFGVQGMGLKKSIESNPLFKLVGFQEVFIEEPDLIFTYGMPDLVEFKVKDIRNHYKKYIPNVHLAVWESSELPNDFIKIYKDVDLIITASTYTVETFKKAGIKAKVLHHGIDERFKYRQPIDDGVFTFLHYNAYEDRKGWEYCLQAFTEEFSEDEPVKLVMKARERKASVWALPKEPRVTAEEMKYKKEHFTEWLQNFKLDIPNVEEYIGHLTDEEMARIFDSADCFLFPAKGEGWGLPPFEAIASGIVPILPNVGAFAEWFDPDTMIEVKSNGFIHSEPRYRGYMFSIDIDDLKLKMRWAYEHQKELLQMGDKGSINTHLKYNWRAISNNFYKLLYESGLLKRLFGD